MKKQASISYEDSRGNIFNLMVEDARRITSANFHKYEWQKEVTEKRFGEILRGWKKSSPEYEVILLFSGPEDERAERLNTFHEALEYDIKMASPGRLIWEEYYIECYGVSSITEPAQDYAESTANQITFYCPNPFWKRVTNYYIIDGRTYSDTSPIVDYGVVGLAVLEESVDVDINAYIRNGSETYSADWLSETQNGPALIPHVGIYYTILSDGEYKGHVYRWNGELYELLFSDYDKDYEDGYDYDYDYRFDGYSNTNVVNDNVLGSKWIIDIYGPADSPFVQFENAGSLITISFPYVTVPDGAILRINSSNKTAIMALSEGSLINCFGARDPDYYLWEDIPGGENKVIWDGTFKFNLTLIDERSEPKWLTD